MKLDDIYNLIENSSISYDDRSRELIALGACLAAHPSLDEGLAAYIADEDFARIGEPSSSPRTFETALRLAASYS